MSKIIKRGDRYLVTDSSVTEVVASRPTIKQAVKQTRVQRQTEKVEAAKKKASKPKKKKEKTLKRKS